MHRTAQGDARRRTAGIPKKGLKGPQNGPRQKVAKKERKKIEGVDASHARFFRAGARPLHGPRGRRLFNSRYFLVRAKMAGCPTTAGTGFVGVAGVPERSRTNLFTLRQTSRLFIH